MAIADDIREYTPGHVFRDGDELGLYWLRDGKVMFRHYPVRGADAESFRFYRGSFAKDHRYCYCGNHKLTGGNGVTFRALNYTYATDGVFVWTMGGKIKDADAVSFIVCDDGVDLLPGGLRVPYGFGKDKDRVFYYDFDGKPNWVRKASPDNFVSLNDGYYGKDANFVFCGAAAIPKANVATWRRIGGHYSKDDRRVFYFNRELRDADYDSFEHVATDRSSIQLARDKNHFYGNDRIIEAADFESLLSTGTKPWPKHEKKSGPTPPS
jgi:hypothetical protein